MHLKNNIPIAILIISTIIHEAYDCFQQVKFQVFQKNTLEKSQFYQKIIDNRFKNPLLRCVSYCSKENLCEFAVHDAKNRSVCYLSYSKLKDNQTLSNNGSIQFYIKKRAFGDLVTAFQPSSNIWYLKLLSNGLLACGSASGTIILLDTYKNIQVGIISGFTNDIRSNKQLSNGDIIARSSVGQLFIIDLQTGSIKRKLHGHSVHVLGIVELNSSFILSGGCDSKLILWDLVNNQSRQIAESHCVYELMLLDDGKVAVAYYNKLIKIFDPFEYFSPNSSRQFISLAADSGAIYIFELLNSSLLATGGSLDILIWDLNNYTRVNTLRGHTQGVFTLKKINEDFLASGSYDKTIKIWNIKTFLFVKTLFVELSGINSLEIATNGYLLSSTQDSIKYFFIE